MAIEAHGALGTHAEAWTFMFAEKQGNVEVGNAGSLS